jgi:hypothetical protein
VNNLKNRINKYTKSIKFDIGISYTQRLCYFQSHLCIHDILEDKYIDIQNPEKLCEIQFTKDYGISMSFETLTFIYKFKNDENAIKIYVCHDKFFIDMVIRKKLNSQIIENMFQHIFESNILFFA